MMFNDDYEGYDTASNNSWFQQTSCCLPSIMTSQSIMALPEMPLQRSVSRDMDFRSDSDKPEDNSPAETNFLNVHVEDVPQNQCYSSGNEKDTQFKRSKHEVHNRSEKRRRNRINRQLKTLQELMPHCKKKDRASVLEEAAKYIRLLQHQMKIMSNLQYPYALSMQQGAGMCVGCYAQLPPFFQLPAPSSTTVASFRIPSTQSNK